jgi:putative beta-barrel porin BBP2
VGLNLSMVLKRLISIKTCARLFFCALFVIVWIPISFAQQPPLNVAGGGKLPAQDPNAITVDGWLLYPTLRLYTLYSDNLFFAPTNPLSAGAIGLTPSMVAVWSNGIHTTTLYGNIDRQDYPADSEVNTLDGRAGITQKYEAMRDLIFTANINYTHTTWAAGLQNSIQTPSAAPTTTVLPNGDTVLPNGTILSPSGQPIGQTTPPAASGAQLFVNPSNQYTGTFSVDKIFNRGIISLSESINRTDFENETAQQNFNSRTFSEKAGFWLGPLFYAYSNGAFSTIVTDATFGAVSALPSQTTTSYLVQGGLGTRQSAIIFGSAYFGHQGSNFSGAAAEGNLYGASLSYRPTNQWALTGTIDRTINIASQPFSANLALTLPGLTAAQVPISASTEITTGGLRLSYDISRQWFLTSQLSYSRIDYIDSPRVDNEWVIDTTLRYDIWRNTSVTWEYRYSSIISNAPLVSATVNYGVMGVTYKF